jgi:hypothetical protein
MITLAISFSQKISVIGAWTCLAAAVALIALAFFGWFGRLKAAILTIFAALLVIAFGAWLVGAKRSAESPPVTAEDIAKEVAKALPASPLRPEINEVVIRMMEVKDPAYIPEIGKTGIKVSMLLDNGTVSPNVELENVLGRVWAENKYLLAKIAQTMSPLDHPWTTDRARREYRIWEPVLAKMSFEWLPTLVFALPPPGEKAYFGAEVVSKTTDHRMYRWWLENENSKGVVRGGDATPKTTEAIPK